MGWWDTGIMGGDGPLDTEYDLQEKFGKSIDITSDEAYNYIAENDKYYDEHVPSVVGLLMMNNGRHIDARLKAKIVEKVEAERKDLEMWSNPDERDAALVEFLEKLNAYDGKPTSIKQTGLFEKIYEDMG